MLFWIFVAMLVGGIVWLCNVDWCDDIPPILVTVIAAGAVVFSLIAFAVDYSSVDANVAKMNERYESLVYQYENNLYDNDNDVGKKELIKEIREWNENLAYYQSIQDNFWVGIYYPNIYDQFNKIELTPQQ